MRLGRSLLYRALCVNTGGFDKKKKLLFRFGSFSAYYLYIYSFHSTRSVFSARIPRVPLAPPAPRNLSSRAILPKMRFCTSRGVLGGVFDSD